MIGKAQMAIVDYYMAKERWLKDRTGSDVEFISCDLIAEICTEWTDEECTSIINMILNNIDYFDSSTCPHCIKYWDIIGCECDNCTYRKIYGTCRDEVCTSSSNPWNYYSHILPENVRVPKKIINILKRGL